MNSLLNYLKDEHLLLAKMLSFGFHVNRLARYVTNLLFVGLLILTAVQTFIFLRRFDGLYFIQYVPGYAASFYILVSIYCTPHVVVFISTMLLNLDLWTIDSASLRTRKRIQREAIYLNTTYCIILTASMASAILHALPLEGDEEIFYPLTIFEEYLPLWKTFLSFMFRVSYIPICMIMSAVYFVMIYGISIWRLQIYLLIDYLENVDGTETNMEELLSDEEYQSEIKNKLRLFSERHVAMIRIFYQVLGEFRNYIYYFSVTGTGFIISILTFLFSFQGSYEGRYPRIVTLVIAIIVMAALSIVSGQSVEDVSNEAVEALLRLKWYHWKIENMKTYLIIVTNTQRTLSVKFSETMAGNYALGVSMAKWVYSMLSVLRQLHNIDYSRT